MRRPVDLAISADTPAKATVRGLWIDQAISRSAEVGGGEEPLYLTLAGAEGREISLLVERGLLDVSEVGSVTHSHRHRVIAVESSPLAVLELKRRFPGLKVLEASIANVLHGPSPTRWPLGEHERFCRARVVNLDLNTQFEVPTDQSHVFPVVALIAKMAQLHAATPRVEWTLCLTLHGELSDDVLDLACPFLRENFSRDIAFMQGCELLLGGSLFARIVEADYLRVRELTQTEQQLILMAAVPKFISHTSHTQGWRVETKRNLRYAGGGGAPMVSWIMEFIWDPRVATTPSEVYCDSIRTIPLGVAHIAQDGSVE